MNLTEGRRILADTGVGLVVGSIAAVGWHFLIDPRLIRKSPVGGTAIAYETALNIPSKEAVPWMPSVVVIPVVGMLVFVVVGHLARRFLPGDLGTGRLRWWIPSGLLGVLFGLATAAFAAWRPPTVHALSFGDPVRFDVGTPLTWVLFGIACGVVGFATATVLTRGVRTRSRG